MIPYTSALTPAIDSAAPSQSSRGARGSLVSGTSHHTPSSATTTIGTLIKKIEPQAYRFSRNPPTSGPSASPAKVIAEMIATARSRSCFAFSNIEGSTE
jgi:hypothetical protein